MHALSEGKTVCERERMLMLLLCFSPISLPFSPHLSRSLSSPSHSLPRLILSSLSLSGMPTAYDLSTVMGSGSTVSHNNLIPLGRILRTD